MNFRESVLRTANKNLSKDEWLVAATLGLLGEGGEFSEHIKKLKYHGKSLDRDKVLSELSDVRYYLEMLCWALDTTLEEIEDINVDKLKKRWPEGFLCD